MGLNVSCLNLALNLPLNLCCFLLLKDLLRTPQLFHAGAMAERPPIPDNAAAAGLAAIPEGIEDSLNLSAPPPQHPEDRTQFGSPFPGADKAGGAGADLHINDPFLAVPTRPTDIPHHHHHSDDDDDNGAAGLDDSDDDTGGDFRQLMNAPYLNAPPSVLSEAPQVSSLLFLRCRGLSPSIFVT